jgi:aconitate hydratase
VFEFTDITALNEGTTPKTVHVSATPSEHSAEDKQPVEFDAVVRIDTPGEADYYRNGGILQYVLRSLVA